MTKDEESKVADIIKDMATHIESLQRENEELRKDKDHIAVEKAGIARNAHNNVDYWKSQAEAAEAGVKRLREELDAAASLFETLDEGKSSDDVDGIMMRVMAKRNRTALSARVQDESEIVDCLLAGKPFVFDPATNFCHRDDGGAPEHGIKYVPAAQVQDVAGWQPIETAPKDKTPIIIAVPTKDRDDWIVGEGYFDPDHYEGGDWWWANLGYGDYHAGPISECNHWPPELWQPLPVPAAAPAKQEG